MEKVIQMAKIIVCKKRTHVHIYPPQHAHTQQPFIKMMDCMGQVVFCVA